ncbi:Gfo/Idh/MocA family oxidoreductase [Paraburkholderia dipogonis]|uniref:Gfo/Idh/MocA family oxidoreductase n=1 Tax=Paraburkholderia dipogonis TaxID=1211383 RepID=UPI0038BDE4B6
MSEPLRICIAGAGAFGVKHIEALSAIDGAVVTTLVGRDAGRTAEVGARFGIGDTSTDFAATIARKDIDAVILCTPTGVHAAQGLACLAAGKHVQIEIPIADNLADAQALLDAQRASGGLVGMAGHTRRFNPSHQWIHRKVAARELTIQHLVAQTFFFRRTNTNALGEPRSWTDHLLWHHACHTVDLFAYQTGEHVTLARAIEGPPHPVLGIAMDMSIQMKARSGALCTLALSFNNNGPLGTTFRYICDNGTFVASYDDLTDHNGKAVDVSRVDVSMNGIELQDRAFVEAIRTGRQAPSSFESVLPAYVTLDRLAHSLNEV